MSAIRWAEQARHWFPPHGGQSHTRRGTLAGRGLGSASEYWRFPQPLRHFLAQLDELRSGDILDMDQVGGSWWSWPPTRSISVR